MFRNFNNIKSLYPLHHQNYLRQNYLKLPLCISCRSDHTLTNRTISMENVFRKAQNRKFLGFEKDKNSSWNGPFYFIQGADTQFGLIERYIEKKEEHGWEKEIKLTTEAIEAINSMSPRPRFFVVCGDLIDALPGSRYRKAQETDFFKVFKQLHPDIPLICVCGNHDVGDAPTHQAIKEYKEKFGDEYFSFFYSGVMFIVLNSQYYADASHVEDLFKEFEIWLDEQLKEAKSGKYKHVIIFQHIPWFVEMIEEDSSYFNLSPLIREKMLQKFYDSNVRAIFCGHWHGNGGGFYKDLELVVTSAVGGQLRGDKSGFRVVIVGENSIKHKYYAIEDAPKNISFN